MQICSNLSSMYIYNMLYARIPCSQKTTDQEAMRGPLVYSRVRSIWTATWHLEESRVYSAQIRWDAYVAPSGVPCALRSDPVGRPRGTFRRPHDIIADLRHLVAVRGLVGSASIAVRIGRVVRNGEGDGTTHSALDQMVLQHLCPAPHSASFCGFH